MKYISWILPSGRIYSRSCAELAEEDAAEYADLLPKVIFFYTDDLLSKVIFFYTDEPLQGDTK